MTIETVRGMKDILPPGTFLWIDLEQGMRTHFITRGYQEIRTPILEKTELFTRSIGETTDIVEKETYTFEDRSGVSLTLRPEGTAPVVRAFLEHRGSFKEIPARLFYLGPMFRHERPQRGRLRQFHQAGAEILGSREPYVDAEVLITLHDLFRDLKLTGVTLELNSLGCPQCRPAYNASLLEFIRNIVMDLCGDCKRRYENNPMRVLDCKSSHCIELTEHAPSTLEYTCPECREHFREVKRILSAHSVEFHQNRRMVRGLDYYQRTTFEFLAGSLGAQNAVAAGGRYDGLAETIGSREKIPGVGFAIGIERLVMIMARDHEPFQARFPQVIFIALQSLKYADEAFSLKRELENNGVPCQMDYEGKSLKSQMRRANRVGATSVVILGEAEMERGRARLKNMKEGGEKEVLLTELIDEVMGQVNQR